MADTVFCDMFVVRTPGGSTLACFKLEQEAIQWRDKFRPDAFVFKAALTIVALA